MDTHKGEKLLISMSASGREFKVSKPDKYLEVIYKDDDFEIQHLFFDECDDPKKFVNTFKKCKL